MTDSRFSEQDIAPESGEIYGVSGPVVVAKGLASIRLYNVVEVGHARLAGEVIRLDGDAAVIQVYEDTSGLTAGDPVLDTGETAACRARARSCLGRSSTEPNARSSVLARSGDDPWGTPMIARGVAPPPLDRTRAWELEPAVVVGVEVGEGDVLGTVQETRALVHRILVPPGRAGTVTAVRGGKTRVDEPAFWIDGEAVTMLARWPVRWARPVAGKLDLDTPLVTGQRSIDTLFPLARGGTATIPGGFGTGKTVLEQSLAKWGDADVIVYIACGERGNELTEMLAEFPELDRSSYRLLLDGADDPHCEYEQHARCCARGKHLHGNHARRVLPRSGLSRRAHGRQHESLGRSAP